MASPQQNPQDGEYAEEAQSPLPSECAGGGDEGSNVNSWDAPCASPSPGFFSENGCPESNPGASRGNGGPAQSRHTMLHGRSVRKHSQSCASAEAAEPKEEKKQGHFVDAAAMKERVRARIAKPKYDVSIYYKDYGVWPVIAKDANFEKATLFVIITNALWIAADTNYNKHELLYQAKPVFQIAENLFCAFFGFEWFVRMMSFRRKLDGLRDAWFVFDGTMVTVMIFETWAFTLVVINTQQDGAVPGTQIVRFARIMRLSRMCRMARLLRAMPELFVMIKGLFAAARSVFFTLVLLAVLLLIFAIAFKQLTFNTKLGDDLFPNIGQGMYVLLVHGTLLLSADVKAKQIVTEGGPLLEAFFFLFILFAAILLMNMLIGVLCSVVSAVAATEKEEMLVSYVGEKLTKVMALIDEDGGGTISRDEFMQILENEEAIEALQDVGVDVIGLVDFVSFIFGDDKDPEDDASDTMEVELTLPEFMEVILQLRGCNNATVKDVVDLRKFVRTSIYQTSVHLDNIEATNCLCLQRMRENLEMLGRIRCMTSKPLSLPCTGDDKLCTFQGQAAIGTPSKAAEVSSRAEADVKALDSTNGPTLIFDMDSDPRSKDLLMSGPGSLVADIEADIRMLDGTDAMNCAFPQGLATSPMSLPTSPWPAMPRRSSSPPRQERGFPEEKEEDAEQRGSALRATASMSPSLPETATTTHLNGGSTAGQKGNHILEMIIAPSWMDTTETYQPGDEEAPLPIEHQLGQKDNSTASHLKHKAP
eukprot:TRINITY_DN6930_c0_g1_i1.p1 TRINITY_DN6930_c0_g1~~TRINITY_DN6930_c0_g1_i1.p1  ORF type:complete len:761 (+),score=168.37 TRINITY_DN6930_c0_g1_i1:73-2355(+)